MFLSNKMSNKVDNISNSDVAPTTVPSSTSPTTAPTAETGIYVPEDEKGMLRYKGGTVCDNDF